LDEIPRDAARSDAKPCIVASMAKKKTSATTKANTPASPKRSKPDTDALAERRKLDDVIRQLEDQQAGRAVARAIRWARLLDQLETLLDRADDLFTHGVPVDFDHVKQWHAKLHAAIDAVPEEDLDDETGSLRPTLGDVRKMESDAETYVLAETLQLAENRLPMIGVDLYENGHSRALADVRRRLKGEAPFDATATPAEALALAITCVRMLLKVDLARAKSFTGVPSEEDLDVLDRLRGNAKTAKELSKEIVGNDHKIDEKKVWRTIERLKKVHGFELPNVPGSGYALSPSDRARLDALLRGS